jgi:hypothetical protein
LKIDHLGIVDRGAAASTTVPVAARCARDRHPFQFYFVLHPRTRRANARACFISATIGRLVGGFAGWAEKRQQTERCWRFPGPCPSATNAAPASYTRTVFGALFPCSWRLRKVSA